MVVLLGTMLSTATAFASQTLISVDIVDDPRPVEKWGYAPTRQQVAVGTWVTWSNSGYDAHTVTALDTSFDSGILLPSEGFSWYFEQDGTFDYLCTLHDWMVGSVVVGSGVAAEQPPAPEEPVDPAPEEPIAE
jgi:plastocyanin